MIPSLPEELRLSLMYPYARSLDAAIRKAGSRPVFFLTWGYRDGDQANLPGDSYAAMQARLNRGYGRIAQELHDPLAPVGPAWEKAHARRPALSLWAGDGMHPAVAGSYLTACVFYAIFYGQAPAHVPWTAGLEKSDAEFLQGVAAETVAAGDPSAAVR